MAASVLKQDPNTKRFKRTLIYFNTDTQYAHFRGTDIRSKTMKNERKRLIILFWLSFYSLFGAWKIVNRGSVLGVSSVLPQVRYVGYVRLDNIGKCFRHSHCRCKRGSGMAQRLERRTRDPKVASSSPGWRAAAELSSSGSVFYADSYLGIRSTPV